MSVSTGKNPEVDTSFLPDRDREEEENRLRFEEIFTDNQVFKFCLTSYLESVASLLCQALLSF